MSVTVIALLVGLALGLIVAESIPPRATAPDTRSRPQDHVEAE